MTWHPAETDMRAFITQCTVKVHNLANESVFNVFALNRLLNLEIMRFRLYRKGYKSFKISQIHMHTGQQWFIITIWISITCSNMNHLGKWVGAFHVIHLWIPLGPLPIRSQLIGLPQVLARYKYQEASFIGLPTFVFHLAQATLNML